LILLGLTATGCAPSASTNTNGNSSPVAAVAAEKPTPPPKTTAQLQGEAAAAKLDEEAHQRRVIEDQKRLEELKKKEEETRKKAEEANKPKTEQEYKASTKPINYKQLIKDPAGRKGEAVSLKGKVFQVQPDTLDDGTKYELFMMNTSAYGDNVAVIYPSTTEYTKDDTLRVWGEVIGSYDYESVAGYNLSIPLIRAGYIHP